jgi:hypothetical protein
MTRPSAPASSLRASGAITFQPGAGQTQTVSNIIDRTGSGAAAAIRKLYPRQDRRYADAVGRRLFGRDGVNAGTLVRCRPGQLTLSRRAARSRSRAAPPSASTASIRPSARSRVGAA